MDEPRVFDRGGRSTAHGDLPDTEIPASPNGSVICSRILAEVIAVQVDLVDQEPPVETHNPVRQVGDFLNIGRGDDDGGSLVGEFAKNLVDLRPGAHIDTACGFVDEDDLRGDRQPLSECHLLLVSARQDTRFLGQALGVYRETHGIPGRHLPFVRVIKQPVPGNYLESRRRHVFNDRSTEKKTIVLPVLRTVGDAPADRILRTPGKKLFALKMQGSAAGTLPIRPLHRGFPKCRSPVGRPAPGFLPGRRRNLPVREFRPAIGHEPS